jgi:alpha-ketoglutarate-dependent taurine dioxygenase
MSARRVAVEVYLGYKEEISQQALEHKIFGFKERRTHRLHLQYDYEESVGPCRLWVMMDNYVTQHLKTLLYSITQRLLLLCYCIEMYCPIQLTVLK